MTISTTSRVAGPFVATGVEDQVLPFSFKISAATEVEVVSVDPETGVNTPLSLDVHYTVLPHEDQADQPGGTVTLALGTAGHHIYVSGSTLREQASVFASQGGSYPRAIEAALDKLTAMVQEQDEILDRAVLLPLGSDLVASDVVDILTGAQPSFEDLPETYGYTGDYLTTIIKTSGATTYTQTLTYTGGQLTAISGWVQG